MRNPWSHDPEDVPADGGVNPGAGRLRTVGFSLWALCIGVGTLLVLVRPGELTSEDGVALAGMAVVTVVLAVLVGVLATLLMHQLSAFGARLVGAGLLLLILLAMPFVVPWLTDQLGLFEQLPVDDSLVDQLPVARIASGLPFSG